MSSFTCHGGDDAADLLDLLRGAAWVAQAVYVAAQLGIADVIAVEGPRSPGDLAERVDADPDALFRVLCALAGIGVVTERADGTFALTRSPSRTQRAGRPAPSPLKQPEAGLNSAATGNDAFEEWTAADVDLAASVWAKFTSR